MPIPYGRIWHYLQQQFRNSSMSEEPTAETPSIETLPPPDDTVPGSAPEAPAAADPRGELEAQCSELGDREARRSWELEPDKRTLKALETKGAGLAISAHRPQSEANDRRKLEKFRAVEAEIKKRTAARDRAKAVSQLRNQELAALGPSKPYPVIKPMLIQAATLGLAISIAPTLHDLFVGLDSFLKWLAGGGAAWGVSFLIIHGILPTDNQPEEENQQ